jgi:hypothetical protein
MEDFMTTLIITETGFYSDGRITSDTEIVSDSFRKVFEYKGRAVATTGDSHAMPALAKALIDDDCLIEFSDSTGSVHIHYQGVTRYVSADDGSIKTSRHTGIETYGTGGKYALAALDFGKTPEEAIRYAMTRDCATGGEIFSVLFEDLEK